MLVPSTFFAAFWATTIMLLVELEMPVSLLLVQKDRKKETHPFSFIECDLSARQERTKRASTILSRLAA
jgi:hypothetical protein